MAGASSSPPTEGDWPTTPADYEIVEQIGKGAFASVFRARCLPLGMEVAIKIMALDKLQNPEDLDVEVRAMRTCRHSSVLNLYCTFVDKSDLWLVMPLMDLGSCQYILRVLQRTGELQDGQGLSEPCIAAILRQAVEGLQYLHRDRMIHRDIKAGNILLNRKGEVKLADFGVAGLMGVGERDEGRRGTMIGTPTNMAPEVMRQDERGYNTKADIWSIGITAMELAKGQAPYQRMAPMEVIRRTLKEAPPTFALYQRTPHSKEPSSALKSFVQACLQADPERRPTATQLLDHAFLAGAKEDVLARDLVPSIPVVGRHSDHAMAGPGAGGKPTGGADRGGVLGGGEFPGSDRVAEGTTWVFPEDEDGEGGGEGDGGAGGGAGGIDLEAELGGTGSGADGPSAGVGAGDGAGGLLGGAVSGGGDSDEHDDDDDEGAASRRATTPKATATAPAPAPVDPVGSEADSDDEPAVARRKKPT